MSPSTTPQLPSKQTAVLAVDAGKLRISHDVAVPAATPNMVVVKTAAVAISPVDAKMLDYNPVPGAVEGYDFAGAIVALGPDTPSHLSIGDRICGTVHGMNPGLPEIGAFCEYVAAPADLVLKISDEMTFEDAASIGLGLFTAGLGLFQDLGVSTSRDDLADAGWPANSEFVLVAGGSTVTGTRAIQLLKPARYRPITTCSPRNFELCLRFGAEKVFDYASADCAVEIRAYTRNTLAYAFDCVAMADTVQLCYGAIGRAGGRYVTLEPFREAITSTRPTIKPSWILALTVFGRKVDLKGGYQREAVAQDLEFARKFTIDMQAALDQGKLDIHPIKVMGKGWEDVIEGVHTIHKQPLSGQKMVYAV